MKVLARIVLGLCKLICFVAATALGLTMNYIMVGLFTPDPLSRVSKKAGAVVRLSKSDIPAYKSPHGTGFQVKVSTGKQFIVTNAHVCLLGQESGFMLATSKIIEDTVLPIMDIDWKDDLCILAPLPALEMKNQNITLSQLDDTPPYIHAFVAGFPYNYELVVTEGVTQTIQSGESLGLMNAIGCLLIGGTPDPLNPERCLKVYERRLFNTAYALPGNSGSPLLNSMGEVIGVVSAISADFNHAVPLKDLRQYLEQL